MRVTFKDGSVVEHVAAAQGIVVADRLLLKTAEGDIVADIPTDDVATWGAIL
jgi:hypothetical protein